VEFKQLEVFVCVARTLNFSKAAEELFISQPSVSAQIRALEKVVGSQLLVRNTKGVALTKAGLQFLLSAKKMLSLRDQAIHSLSGGDREAHGSIDIISSTIPAQHLLPGIIASFQKEWPNVVIRLEQADSHRVLQEMGSFNYDFGLVGSDPVDDRFICHAIYDDELVLALPKGSQVDAGLIREGFADYILRTPFLMRESGSGTRMEIEKLFSKIGVQVKDLHIPAYFSDAHSILQAVSHGMGVSLISRVATKMFADAGLIDVIEMGDPLFRRQIFLIYNKEILLPQANQAFVDLACGFY